MIGDEGSGWWIGCQGLIVAISASDGRQPNSAILLAAAEELFGPIQDVPNQVAAAQSPAAVVAGFAPAVAEAARQGDAVALSIWSGAGEYICISPHSRRHTCRAGATLRLHTPRRHRSGDRSARTLTDNPAA
jgi:N-acetylglucosamine kinase-like BadF-type ATPase